VEEMIGHGAGSKFRTRVTSWSIRIVGNIEDGTDDEGFVTQAALFAEVFMCPGEDRL